LRIFILSLLFVSLALIRVDATAADTAQAILDRAQEQVDAGAVTGSTSQDLEKIVENDPKNARARLLMGECLQLIGLKEQALEQFKLALSYGPDYPPAYVGLVKELLREGQLGQARTLIQQAKAKFPKDHEIEFWLGNFYQSREQDTEAMRQYQEAAKSEKPIIGLGSAMGKIAFTSGKYFDAIVYANQDLRLKPKMPLANQIKGMALHEVGRFGEAIPPLAIAFNANAFNKDVSYAYAQSLYWKGDFKAALTPALMYLANTAHLNANDPKAKRLVSDVIARLPSEKVVSEGITSVVLIYPINKMPAYHFALGDVLDRHGYTRIAMREYETGLRFKPDFGRAWYRLGLDYESKDGNYEAALDCYKKARLYLPGDKQLVWQQTRLEDRLANRKDDLAWQIKDKMRTLSNKK